MDEKPALTDVLIELHVPDFEIVKDFYGKLGFVVVWNCPPSGKSGYLVLKPGERVFFVFIPGRV